MRQIWPRYLAGASLMDLARWLNGQGVLAHRGRAWSPTGVRTLLLSERAIGLLVDADVQAQVRAEAMRRVGIVKHRASDRASPLRGIPHCECGSTCVTVSATGACGTTYWYYRCTGRGHGTCKFKDRRCDAIEAEVFTLLAEAVRLDKYQNALHDYLEGERGARERAGVERGRALGERDRVKARLAALALDGPRPGSPEFKAMLEPLADQLRELNA